MEYKIAIVGKGASGKDYLKNILINLYNYNFCVPYTTRPPRPNEINGVDYDFVDEYQTENVLYSDRYNITKNVTWEYGMKDSNFKNGNLLVLTPKNLSELPEYLRSELKIVYIDCSEDVIVRRLSSRVSADNMYRRIESDRKDFLGFTDYDYIIDGEFTENDVEELLYKVKMDIK